jgi:hypothetical protein
MSFNPSVPNASKSPSLFPPQNITNMGRIQANLNAEHNFLNSNAAAQGIHKQCTFINRTAPSSLPAGNGVLYTKNDSFSTSQLYWYNGSTTEQITPASLLISGNTSVPDGIGSAYTIFADPLYKYQAVGFVSVYNTDISNRLDYGINLIRFGTPTTNWISTSSSGVKVFFR